MLGPRVPEGPGHKVKIAMSPREVPDQVGKPGIRARLASSPRLRGRLLLLVGACSLPLFVFGFGNAYFDYQADRAEAGRRALNMTRSLALLVQRDLEARLSTLQVLAMSQALQAGDIASFRVRAAAVLRLQLPGANIV